jgi:hypothetical protein
MGTCSFLPSSLQVDHIMGIFELALRESPLDQGLLQGDSGILKVAWVQCAIGVVDPKMKSNVTKNILKGSKYAFYMCIQSHHLKMAK